MPTRRGITLVELLVVLGLMVALSTIGITAFASANRVSRLTATRDLVSDLVRQARTTARTTGQPVMLQIRTGGTGQPAYLRGVFQSLVFADNFQALAPHDTTPPRYRTEQGFTGRGFVLPDTWETIPERSDVATLEPRYRLRPDDGFLLQVRVRVPSSTAGSDLLPLVMVSTTTTDEANTSLVGLRLLKVTPPLFPDPVRLLNPATSEPDAPLLHQPTSTTPWTATTTAWMLQGWVRLSGRPVMISELLAPVNGHNLWSTTSSERDQAMTTVLRDGGDAWATVGLLWDGEQVHLLREGLPVARKPASGRLDPGTAQHVILGHTTFPAWGDEIATNGAPAWAWTNSSPALPASVPLDDVTLERLGSGEEQRLPPGVVPTADATLRFFPDGTCTGTTSLSFRGIAEDQGATVTMTIAPTTGAITDVQVQPRP